MCEQRSRSWRSLHIQFICLKCGHRILSYQFGEGECYEDVLRSSQHSLISESRQLQMALADHSVSAELMEAFQAEFDS
ncbi:MAG: hypothetical protein DMG84_21015, partial [Acidobacteria bacterium]